MWDGDTVTLGSTQSETTMQDQSGETKERLKEPVPQKNIPSPNTDEENLSAVLQKDMRIDAAAETTEMQTTLEEEREDPKMGDGEKVVFRDIIHDSQNEKEISTSSGDNVDVLLKYPTLEGSMEKTNCPEKNQSKTENSKEMLQASNADTSKSPDECWDDYIVTTGNPLLSNSQTYLKIDEQHDAQTGWHFPVGPGLAQEVFCPQWSFPASSYYTTVEPTVPFEGRRDFYFCFK